QTVRRERTGGHHQHRSHRNDAGGGGDARVGRDQDTELHRGGAEGELTSELGRPWPANARIAARSPIDAVAPNAGPNKSRSRSSAARSATAAPASRGVSNCKPPATRFRRRSIC